MAIRVAEMMLNCLLFSSIRPLVVIYGSSITQGASASRPGLAYPSILSRRLEVEFINLGFSGSGKMELEVAKILAKMPADIIILDCVPNPAPQEIEDRAFPFISYLVKKSPKFQS